LWAISGALLAARRGYAILGIFTVALVSAAGGGLLRDGIFLQTIPVLVQTPIYLYLIVAAVTLVLFFGARLQLMKELTHIVGPIDALGLGAYAVVGMNRALAADLPLIGVAVVGVVNAVGGGILRDRARGLERANARAGIHGRAQPFHQRRAIGDVGERFGAAGGRGEDVCGSDRDVAGE
jgi:uncharacterized membrane protein YeiH